jgi:hypothetical protein
MIYLIGVNHRIQHNGNNSSDLSKRNGFINYLLRKVNEFDVLLIAEEFNQEALTRSDATKATAKIAAEKARIEHRFCDPDSQERVRIGIPSCVELQIELFGKAKTIRNHKENELLQIKCKKFNSIREKYWFEKIKDKSLYNVVFICGDDHIESFQSLLNGIGIETVILAKGWGN